MCRLRSSRSSVGVSAQCRGGRTPLRDWRSLFGEFAGSLRFYVSVLPCQAGQVTRADGCSWGSWTRGSGTTHAVRPRMGRGTQATVSRRSAEGEGCQRRVNEGSRVGCNSPRGTSIERCERQSCLHSSETRRPVSHRPLERSWEESKPHAEDMRRLRERVESSRYGSPPKSFRTCRMGDSLIKADDGQLRPDQVLWHRRALKLGTVVQVVTGSKEARNWTP